MSDTPRCDAIADRHAGETMDANEANGQYNDLLDLARQLETELRGSPSAAASVVTEEGFTHQIHFMQRQSQMLAEQGDDVAARVMADAAKMAADVWKDRERYRQGMANWKRTAEAKDAVSSGSPSASTFCSECELNLRCPSCGKDAEHLAPADSGSSKGPK